ncbi:hypothetical protein TrRE_jg245 [Triparma retinervis]|uniref:UBC core domain-containing protein n=1 Tax=Triparma retinervis TaxID=2557542 RepID=A0A9W7DVI4_9STRA|nr:hypothetical protein TrRE_jg245 [Triparma retinervis]
MKVSVGRNLRIWHVKITGRNIYAGSVFTLRIKYPPSYPRDPPSVYFVGPVIPSHEHVYSNGDICLSLLGAGWSPTLTGQGIAVSVQSILKSARRKGRPVDNSGCVGRKPGESQKDWIYHDDNC